MPEIDDGVGLTHFDAEGRARMVDVGAKSDTVREATAQGFVRMLPSTASLIEQRSLAKGDVLAVAQIAAIQAAKRTWELVPLCHNIPLSGVEVTLMMSNDPAGVAITATVRAVGKTGAEMEALTAVSVAALTVYDMCKAVDRGIVIDDIRLLRKSGGKSGRWEAAEP